jgi:hypothetical protein
MLFSLLISHRKLCKSTIKIRIKFKTFIHGYKCFGGTFCLQFSGQKKYTQHGEAVSNTEKEAMGWDYVHLIKKDVEGSSHDLIPSTTLVFI